MIGELPITLFPSEGACNSRLFRRTANRVQAFLKARLRAFCDACGLFRVRAKEPLRLFRNAFCSEKAGIQDKMSNSTRL